MSDIQEASSLTLKNGITYLLKDAKAREQIANLLSNLLVEYGEGNVPPLGKVAVEDVVPISEGGTEATTAAQASIITNFFNILFSCFFNHVHHMEVL